MKKLLLQTDFNGEKFEIWETEQSNCFSTWQEMDEKPEEKGWIYLVNEDGKEVDSEPINGGF